MRGLPLVVASGGHSSSRRAGLSLSRPLLLRRTGSRRAGSVAAAHGPSRSAACGILPDQGSNPCALHWQADSQPLRHQGSPQALFFKLPSEYSAQTGDRSVCSPEKRGLTSKTWACASTMQGCAEQSRVWGGHGHRPPHKPVCCPSTVAPHPGSGSLLSENY